MHILDGRGAALKGVAENEASYKTRPTTRLQPLTYCRTFTAAHNIAPHRTVHSAMSALRTWTVTLEGVTQPETFRQRLVKSPFYGRVESPSVSVEGMALTFTFSSSTLDRNGVNKKCTQTFRAYGAYERHAILEQTPTSTASASATSSVAEAPVHTLATRSRVEDAIALAAGMSRLELHSVAVFYGLRYLEQTPAPQMQFLSRILQAKAAASAVFLGLAASWEDGLADHAAQIVDTTCPCNCCCGCTVRSGGTSKCWGCGKLCCAQCHPAARERRWYGKKRGGPWAAHAVQHHGLDGIFFAYHCHACVRQPKATSVPLEPPSRPAGLQWYFNFPKDAVWCAQNRDPKADPQLLDILEVCKTKRLANDTRAVRPAGWENAFSVDCLLGGANGDSVRCAIGFGALVMNPQWKAHPIVSFIKEWLPSNLGYVGPVLKPPPLLPADPPAPPSPRSPGLDDLLASTVCIEDVTDGAATEESASPEEVAEINEFLKRDREEREAAAAQMMASFAKRPRRD